MIKLYLGEQVKFGESKYYPNLGAIVPEKIDSLGVPICQFELFSHKEITFKNNNKCQIITLAKEIALEIRDYINYLEKENLL